MASQGLSTLGAFYGAQHNMLRPDPILLLLDYRCLGPAALIIPVSGSPRLILSPVWDLARAREAVGAVATVTAVEEDALPQAMAAEMLACGGPLALAGTEIMPVGLARRLMTALGSRPADGAEIIRTCGATRMPSELARVARAASIADEGFQHLCEIARPGMWEYEIAAELECAMQKLGSEDNFGLMSTGEHNVAVRAVRDRKLSAGDLIVSEITPCHGGYFAQLCRTLVLGVPTDLQKEKFDLLLRAEDAGLARAKPGLPTSGIAKAVNEVIGAAGYADYCRPPYMRTRGHGLGLGGVTPSDLNESSGGTLKPDMTMVVHPNQYIPETGYLMLGDTIAITDDGHRLLTQTARRLFSGRA
jgi:Xaa-Pro aminopeptidase